MPRFPSSDTHAEAAEAVLQAPVVVEVRDLSKTFRIPDQRVDSLKERAVHPFRKRSYRELEALKGISFDVHEGEFFGIVGLNGSGKSTLLKILGSIYRADRGSIRVAGRMAPFIELGVGFNPEMNARENIVLNAVMMGLSRQEAEAIVPAVLEFAGLEDFADLKLKNYSSGMMVRLAFSVMVEAEADIMLIDEVLAVGDAAFQQKCEDVFHDLREAGKTIILVTHDMASIEKFCHRAMMIHNGEVSILGKPEEVSEWYLRANFVERDQRPGFHPGASEEGDDAHVVDAWLSDLQGKRIDNVHEGEDFMVNAVLEGIREFDDPVVEFGVSDQAGSHVFGYRSRLSETGIETIRAGERVRFSAEVKNLLRPGHYYLNSQAFADGGNKDMRMRALRICDFVVFGTDSGSGFVKLVDEVDVMRDGEGA